MIIAETTQLADAAKPFVNRSRLHEFFITDFSSLRSGARGLHARPREVYAAKSSFSDFSTKR